MKENKPCYQVKADRDAWVKLANSVTRIQRELPNISKTRDIILTLLQVDLPLDNISELSIVYNKFGYNNPAFLAYSGRPFSNKMSPNFSINNTYIQNTINQSDFGISYFKNAQQCTEAGFKEYKSVLIVPMRLSSDRNIGVFIIHNPLKENAYKGDIKIIFDQFSDRIAHFIREKIQKNLKTIFTKNKNKLFSSTFKSEDDLFIQFINLMKQWYGRTNDIYIIIKNPIAMDQYFLVCDKGNINKNFKLSPPLSDYQIKTILGDAEIIKRLDKENGLVIDDKNIFDHLDMQCQSWLGANIRHPSGYDFGYVIIKNTHVIQAYEYDDESVLSDSTTFIATLLAEHRKKRRYKFIKAISKYPNKLETHSIYENLYNFLHEFYGIKTLEIALQDPEKQRLDPVFYRGDNQVFNQNIYQHISQHIKGLRDNINTNTQNLTLELNHKNYLISPMRVVNETGIWQIIGCFIIPITTTAHVNDVTANSIDRLSDALAEKLHKINIINKNKILSNFKIKINQLSTDDIDEKSLLKWAYQVVSKVMFTENFYIALYNQNNNKIEFPFILQDGQHWDVVSRLLDPNKVGKTEEIIQTGQPLLHLTHNESKAWYTDTQYPQRNEFAGDYLASWAGVPIFSSDGVIGVIATYHKTENYLYTDDDIFFLQNIASSISSLFRLLAESKLIKEKEEMKRQQEKEEMKRQQEKEEMKRQQEKEEMKRQQEIARIQIRQQEKEKAEQKKQVYIAEQQDLISSTLLAQDLTHRLNNSIGIIKISVAQAIRDLTLTQKNGEIAHLLRTKQSLNNTDEVIDDVIDEIIEISNEKLQIISLRDILEKVHKQVSISKNLTKENITFDLNIEDNVPDDIKANIRTFFNSIYAVADNAVTAVLREKADSFLSRDFFVTIHVFKQKNNILIDISDNGIEIPKADRTRIFQVNPNAGEFSRYGLWRARNIVESLGGSLKILESDLKTFRFIIPQEATDKLKEGIESKKRVYILDDERSWRDQIGWWLEDMNLSIKKAKNPHEMEKLLHTDEIPQLVLLDIALYKREGRNNDGLVFIKKFRDKYPQLKICIITGYAELLGDYRNHVDHIFKKINNETRKVLEQDSFTKKIRELID